MGCKGLVLVYIFFCTFLLFLANPSLAYLQLDLENNKVCSLYRKQEIKLGKDEQPGVIVKGSFHGWTGEHQFNCSFFVTSPNHNGLVAVIQNLVLRKDEVTGECIDFVQFHRYERTLLFSHKVPSQRYCGKVNIFRDQNEDFDSNVQDEPQLARNAFIDENGRTSVNIVVASRSLLPKESIELSIAFTGFIVCQDITKKGFRECHPGSEICIREEFFGDKTVNCPFKDCVDEGGCPLSPQGGKKVSSGLGTKVTIGAVVAILSLLLLFLLCLFVCRHCKVLCWSNTGSARHNCAPPSNRVEMTLHGTGTSTGINAEVQQPSAPPLLSSSSPTSPIHEDKDLPPPYESLFPSR